MEIDFSEGKDISSDMKTVLLGEPADLQEHDLVFNRETIFQDLYNFTVVMKDLLSWTKNVGMTNKAEESVKFRKAWNQEEEYHPRFQYSEFSWNIETVRRVIRQADEACEKIDTKKLRDYPVQKLEVVDFRRLFRGTFEEFRLYAELAANIDQKDEWQKYCNKIWPLNKTSFDRAVDTLENEFEEEADDTEIYAEDLRSMWVEELDRLGIDYEIEVRNVSGCFNIPEDETVVIARGENSERVYTESEARALTMHELFHVIRTYNGNRVMENSGFPPILGLHTPFYDKTEEGGAVYREEATGVLTSSRKKDYALRALAAHYVDQGYDFHSIVEKLINHGATLQRAFALAARNREILRHQVYLDGYHEWKNRKELWPLMLGKVNTEWAEKLRKEVEAGGVVGRPPVGPEKVFESPYID